jgi:hypothetical protein
MLVVHAADVILIDTWLRGEDGFAIGDRLCVPMRRRPTLVGVVGHDASAERLRTRRFDHHVNKPVNVSALAEFLSARSDRRANGTHA